MSSKNHLSLATDDRQLIIFYNSDVKNHREIYAYAESSGKNVLNIDVSKTKVAGTVWTEIADLMNLRVKDLIDTEHGSFVEKYGKDHEITCDGAITFLQKDPSMLLYPIMIQGEKAKEVKIYGEAQDFFDPDTAAIDIP